MFLFFSNTWLCNQVLLCWECKTIEAVQIGEPFDVGIVLGGYSNNHFDRPNTNILFHFGGSAANRLTQAIELFKLGKIKRIMLSGGAANIFGEQVSESHYSNQFLMRLGIPAEDIILESSSRNTYENALFCKNILAENAVLTENSKILLITSASHMYRAKKCFDKVRLSTTPFSVDFHGYEKPFSTNDLIPSSAAIWNWQLLIKEWVGIVAYKLNNRI